MANDNNHGGARPNSGRPAINRVNIQLDLGKPIPSRLDELSVIDIAERRRQAIEAKRVIFQCRDALQTFAPEVAGQLATIGDNLALEIEELKTELDARKEFFHPYGRAAFARLAEEIPREIKGAEISIQRGADAVEAKRKKLHDAGISEEEAARLVPDYDSNADRATIRQLQAEQAEWEKFQQWQLARFIPKNATEAVERLGVYRQ